MPRFLSKTKISNNTSGQASSPQQMFSVLVLTKTINKHIKKGLQKCNIFFFPRVLLICCSEVFQAAAFSLPKQYRKHIEGFRDIQKDIKLHLTATE